jgi:release factor glutamine methyltransferase
LNDGLQVSESEQPAKRSWTIGDVLKWSTQHLKEKGSPSARLDAEIIVAAAVKCKRIDLYVSYDKPLNETERALCRDFIRRRGTGEPVAYIVGHKAFWQHNFQVNKHVLIPRPETELLVDFVVTEMKRNPERSVPLRILDVGTGSGCIAVSLAKELPTAEVEAWELCEDALAVAELNARELSVDNIKFRNFDASESSTWTSAPHGAFDYILSNPPYVNSEDQSLLASAVKKYEPHKALFAPEQGLAFYRMFAGFAGQLLAENGKLIVELGMGQKAAIEQIFTDHGWQALVFQNDLAGIPRVLIASKT